MKNKVLTEKDIQTCAEILKKEEILAFPTETVYGVGVVYDSKIAFEKLVTLKKRPPNKPFALMCDSMEQAYSYVDVSSKAKAVMEAFLPGELTVLVHAKKELPEHVTLGTGVIGIRVPDDVFVSSLIRAVGKPCLVTSANRSGEPTSTNYEEVVKIFAGEVGGIVQGKCVSLVPTTIVSLTDDASISLIREGPIPFAKIEEVWRNAK